MNIRNDGRLLRFILGAVSACALVACAQNAVPPAAQPAPTTDDGRDGTAWRGSARDGLLLSPAQSRPRTSM